jgi:hypothetical protein
VEETLTLYRPTGPQELAFVEASGFKKSKSYMSSAPDFPVKADQPKRRCAPFGPSAYVQR